jgi:hypothetical protein
MMQNSCIKGDFNQWSTIVFDDPHLASGYNDGINNLYEITNSNPWDEIIGYATYIDWPGWETDTDTQITRSDNAKIVLPLTGIDGEVPNIGTLFRRPTFANPDDAACYEGQGEVPDYRTGVKLDIPSEFRFDTVRGTRADRFAGVVDVYVIGRQISRAAGEPKNPAAAVKNNPSHEDATLFISVEKSYDELIKLERGTHYVVAYDNSILGKTPYIVFADNSRKDDPYNFSELRGEPANFYIDPYSAYSTGATSVLTGQGVILPIAETKAIWVTEIWVSVELETPSIVVYHPDGWNNKARSIAETLNYQLAPLVVVDEPAPIAFNGTIIDQVPGIKDHDPTTAQNFEDTPLETALEKMDGGGQSLSMSFLDEEQARRLSDALYRYYNSGDGTQATYVCGPGTNVELGGPAPNGGIVNSITYSYQDSNSYTISVNSGPKIVGGFAQVSGGPTPKQAENDSSAKGTVIQDMGNHIFYKVRIDGYGDRIAVNMSPNVIRVGDKVNCSINNNPVET